MVVVPPARSRFAWLHPRAYLGLYGLVGLGLSGASAWLFFAIADAFPEKGATARIDVAVTAWLQAHGTEWGESVFVWVSYLGSELLFVLLVVAAIALAIRRDWGRLTMLAVTCGGGVVLDNVLKLVFHRPRPAVGAEFQTDSWSFPSGHAMDSLVVYGLLALWLGRRVPRARRRFLLGAAALVVAIGYARIYLGVHYLSDVIAGYCAGLTWLLVCTTGYQFAERRRLSINSRTEGDTQHSE